MDFTVQLHNVNHPDSGLLQSNSYERCIAELAHGTMAVRNPGKTNYVL